MVSMEETGTKVFVRLVSFQGSLVCLVARTLCKSPRVRETMAYFKNCKLFLMAEMYTKRDGTSQSKMRKEALFSEGIRKQVWLIKSNGG